MSGVAAEVQRARPLYIWGPQLEFLWSLTELGPCELFELSNLTQAFAFSEKLAAVSSAGSLPFVRDHLERDIILTDIVFEAQRNANLDDNSAIVQWENIIRHGGASSSERVTCTLAAFNKGEVFFWKAVEDQRRFEETFIQAGFDMLPSAEFSLPMLAASRRFSIASELYKALCVAACDRLRLLAPLISSRIVMTPPLVAILLEKCKTLDEIPDQLCLMRKEFTSLREHLAKYESRLASTSKLGDQLEAVYELEKARGHISKEIGSTRKMGLSKSITSYAWHLTENIKDRRLAAKARRLLVSPSKQLAYHFIDIFDDLMNVNGYFSLLESKFGAKNVDHGSFERFKTVNDHLRQLHSESLLTFESESSQPENGQRQIAVLSRTDLKGPSNMRILFLAANPAQTSHLDLEEELRGIQEELRGVRFRDSITFTSYHAVRPDDLIRHVRSVNPNVIHFSGHGSKNGIILRSDDGGYQPVEGTALARFLEARGVELVVLNACYSKEQAEMIHRVVPTVVGTRDVVGDEAARRFSVAFYRGLGDGLPIREAFRDGGDAVALHGLVDVFFSDGFLDKCLVGQQ